MADVGANPARIIPAWRDFVASIDGGGGRARGIGEPIGRAHADELVEAERHEALLNLAFAGVPAWWLLCPYDTGALGPDVLEEAERNHPFVSEGGVAWPSAAYRGLEQVAEPFATPLPDPPGPPAELGFGSGSLAGLRDLVARHATAAGLDPTRRRPRPGRRRGRHQQPAPRRRPGNAADLAGRRGTGCEVRDAGRIENPMVGRERPPPERDGGRGLWMVNQLCDLVQLRSFPDGATVRVHMYLP